MSDATDSVESLWRSTYGQEKLSGDIRRSFRLETSVCEGKSGEATAAGYSIVAELARGGMGVVYRAQQQDLEREVALKVAQPNVGDTPYRAFLAEALVTGHLEHPNIVPVYDLLDRNGTPALAMKLVGGEPWSTLIKNKPPDVRENLDFHLNVLISVCHAVEFAHSRDLLHCDLKPENVMVGEFGEVLLLDWGLAVDIAQTPAGKARHRDQLENPQGTPGYMSPELVAVKSGQIGVATDIYLLGGCLYEVISGQPPHHRDHFMDTLKAATLGLLPPFPDPFPDGLRLVCERALASSPSARHDTVAQFRESLQDFLRHRDSELITQTNQKRLEGLSKLTDPVYADLIETAAGFRQALVLWSENQRAQTGLQQALELLARTALEHGDLRLAASTANQLDEPDELATKVASAERDRHRAKLNSRRLRGGLVAILTAFFLAMAIATSFYSRRLADIGRLADVQKISERWTESLDPWPARPEFVPQLEAWAEQAQRLIERGKKHSYYLEQFRQNHGIRVNSVWKFSSTGLRWEHETLVELLKDLARLEEVAVPEMQARLEFARKVQQRTVLEPSQKWQQAAASIAKNPRYGGLQLKPQLGLIPLREDPESGLWEFTHPQSGEPPKLAANGTWALEDETGIVLVLLPGGSFPMGAQPTVGKKNFDGKAKSYEGPVHPVKLAPFFMSKYEMTQGQWQRSMGSNPSSFPPGKKFKSYTHTLVHPVEHITWREASRAVRRLDLLLPTEAQWEYATRGGTETVFWTGDDPHTLAGAANLSDSDSHDDRGPGSWKFEEWLHDGYTVHAPVGSFRANPFGLHDTAGNVWEWVADRYALYSEPVRPGDGLRVSESDSPRVFRGGGFRATTVHARSAERYSLYAREYKGYDIGLRPARKLE